MRGLPDSVCGRIAQRDKLTYRLYGEDRKEGVIVMALFAVLAFALCADSIMETTGVFGFALATAVCIGIVAPLTIAPGRKK